MMKFRLVLASIGLYCLLSFWANLNLVIASCTGIGEAVDNTSFTWTCGGNANWFLQSDVSQDGVDAAQSGLISHGQSTWIETTVTGPTTLSFYWKVSSESHLDRLEFYIDGDLEATISGEVDWRQTWYSIGSGTHIVKWVYSKDISINQGNDTGWVDQVEISGNINIPTLTTTTISSITTNSAVSGGNVTADGGDTVTARGVCWSTSANPTTNNSKTTNGTGTGSFTSSISELTAGTPYYVRAYATNTVGTGYGNQVEFKTKLSLNMMVSPLGSGATTPAVGSTMDVDADVAQDITATANGSYRFMNWTADPSENAAFGDASDPTTTVTLTGSATVTANFALNTYTLTTAANPVDGGTVTRAPDKSDYDHGEEVQITATANANYAFTGWSGDLSGTTNPSSLTMDGNKTVNANFASTYTVTYNGNGNTGGSPPVDENAYQGSAEVTVLGAGTLVKTGYTFSNWNTTAGGSGTFYAVGAKFNMPEANVTLYAQWNSGSTQYVCSDGICGNNTPCQKNLHEAVEAAATGTLIKIAAEEHDGGFSLDADKDLILQGGWDKTFNNPNGGTTTLHRAPKAPQGSLIFQNLKIVP
jgi:uncharacterized repeat protein (TIGR02543 family)